MYWKTYVALPHSSVTLNTILHQNVLEDVCSVTTQLSHTEHHCAEGVRY